MRGRKEIPHNRPWLGREEVRAAGRVIRSGWIAPGEEARRFELEMASQVGRGRHAVAVSSGTAALHLALIALGVGRGDEVILPTYVCSALLNAVFYVGAKPVLTDVLDEDFNMDPREVERNRTRRTRAVIVPHIFGFPARIEEIGALGLPVIEDCAQAPGARIGRRPVGGFGDVAIYSFYATKVLTTGHGGMLITSRRELAARARDLRDYDQRPTYKVRYNYALTDLAASIGRVQLRKLPEMIRLRRMAAARYGRALAGAWQIWCPREREGTRSAFYRYVLRAPEGAIRPLADSFSKWGVRTAVPLRRFELLHRYLGADPRKFPRAENIVRTTLSIPAHPSMSAGEGARVALALRSAGRQGGGRA